MMLPRRSPRLESPPPKRPAKPRQPKRVQDETEDSVRQAQYKTELAEWETANEEHAQLMKRRQAKQTAAWKTAQKGPAKIAPPASAQKGPAKTPAAAAPLSAEELRLVSSPTRSCALGSCETSKLDAQLKRRMINEPVAAKRSMAACEERRRMPLLSPSLIQWITDVEAVARRCGANEAQLVHFGGKWFDEKDYGGNRAAPASHPLLTPHALARALAHALARALSHALCFHRRSCHDGAFLGRGRLPDHDQGPACSPRNAARRAWRGAL